MLFIIFFGVNQSKKSQATLIVEMQIPVSLLFICLKGSRLGITSGMFTHADQEM